MKVKVTTNSGQSIDIELEKQVSRNDYGDEVFYSGDDGENSVRAALNRNEVNVSEESVTKSVGIITSKSEIAGQINEQLHPERFENLNILCSLNQYFKLIQDLKDLLDGKKGNYSETEKQIIRDRIAVLRNERIDSI